MMTIAPVECAQQRWYELVMAEQRGASIPELQRMYHSYIRSLEEYNRCALEVQSDLHAIPLPHDKLTKLAS